jgi:hypothetical protein
VRELIRKLMWLVVPPMTAVYGFPFMVLAMGGELTAVSTVVRRQHSAEGGVLYGVSYTNPVKALKFEALRLRAPAIAVLGTSRVMQFRSLMFRRPETFYNAGGATANLWELRPLLAMIPRNNQPQVLIVGFDQYLFNENYAEFRAVSANSETPWHEIVHNSRWKVYDDYRASKFTLSALIGNIVHRERLGVNAIMNGDGFRNDGSYYYGRFIANPLDPANDDLEFTDTFQRIREGSRRFEYGRRVSREAVDEVQAFLKMCRDRGIHVSAFLPPFAHQVYERMMSMGERYGYLLELESALKPVFAAEGFPLYDFSDLTSVGASDVEMIDGFHASEPAYLRVLLEMRRSDGKLRPYVAESDELEFKLKAATPYVVFR